PIPPLKPPPIRHLSDPDSVWAMSESFEQYGIYYDQYRVFVIPTHLTEDRYVQAIEFVPGNPKIVRHCAISIDTSDRVAPLDAWDPQYGYFSFGTVGFVPTESRWYTWRPTQSATEFAAGEGLFLPRNARLLVHIHYGPTGIPQKDSSQIRVKFAPRQPDRLRFTAPLIHPYNLSNPPFFVPAGARPQFHATFTVPFDLDVYGLFPHAHFLGRKWEIFAVEPEGRQARELLKISDWDFHWKQFFEFEHPVRLRQGTRVHVLTAYDNTPENLLNPGDPPREMGWGKRMYQEMMLVFFQFSVPETASDFGISGTSVNITRPVFRANLQVRKKQTLSARISDFDGSHERILFERRHFRRGTHQIQASLEGLPHGNYYLQLKSESDGQTINRIFVFADAHLMD
ncbi:MAG: hypothetical protein D6714_02835, partial [Bacteroidetes bacterium]